MTNSFEGRKHGKNAVDKAVGRSASTLQKRRTDQNGKAASASNAVGGHARAMSSESELEDSLVPIANMVYHTGVGQFPATAQASSFNPSPEVLEIVASLPETAQMFFGILGNIDNELTRYLRSLHGVPMINMNDILEFPSSVGPNLAVSSNGAGALGLGNPGGSWADCIADRYLVTEPPSIRPENDATLQAVLQRSDELVSLLVTGVYSMDDIQNPESTEARLVRETEREVVTATCTLIMTALIHRCVLGYCGHKKRNKARQDDRRLVCTERFFRVYQALREEKTLCRDVLQEDSEITYLVNAPMTALKTKKNQKHTNDSRKIKEATLKKELNTLKQQQSPMQVLQTAPEHAHGTVTPAVVVSAKGKGKRKISIAMDDSPHGNGGGSGLARAPKRSK
ncbi:hypothetical protein K491DRAFT_775788 [Lophiostoma macrostomum CBS 122681]|uniref:Uncharacterized protein n=1 Tax=Lophiostoma macrostomum CBS 122681 TaxID=1314788 RepID=A0A6A6THC3_9PLEO|nr:hypothetical protein K491DRAFT_775788 [Lophiostoma macrostomum CBS 122681]